MTLDHYMAVIVGIVDVLNNIFRRKREK